MPFASEQLDADAVLRALSGRISQLLASAGLTIEASDQISDAARAALVDTDGHVISVLPGVADVARADKATREAIWGLVEAYRYVLDARHELDRALERAEHAERDALQFAILVVDYTDDRPELLAARIRDCLDDAGVHASVGVAVHTEGHELTEVFSTADAAMYTDKQSNSANRAPRRSTR